MYTMLIYTPLYFVHFSHFNCLALYKGYFSIVLKWQATLSHGLVV
jgi:hypothetical protein